MSKRQAFSALFEEFEFVLKRRGFLRKGLDHAQADWDVFARVLGPSFFENVCARGIATTLIAEPPGRLMRDPLEWERLDRALATTHELFALGVRRVRNSVMHGEKFRGGEAQRARDEVLVSEALAVLEAAKEHLASAQPDGTPPV